MISYRVSNKFINRLTFPRGILLDILPSETSLTSILEMGTLLKMLGQYPSRFSFEIWKDQKFSFHLYSQSHTSEGLIRGHLSSIYPQCEIRKSDSFIPTIKPGDYVFSCTLKEKGQFFCLKNPNDFHSDPLRHLLSAMNVHDSRFIIQFLFEIKRKIPKEAVIVLYQRNISKYVFRCCIRIISLNKSLEKARESCIHLSRIFSVFDSEKSWLVPKFPYFYHPLKGVINRRFTFQKSLLLTIPELASFVHLPVGASDIGVDYSKQSLSW